jgi:hypothetical protein
LRLAIVSELGTVPGTYQGDIMKKKAKKLVLAKETLRSLQDAAMGEAVGGSVYVCPPATWYNSCQRYCQIEPTGDGC